MPSFANHNQPQREASNRTAVWVALSAASFLGTASLGTQADSEDAGIIGPPAPALNETSFVAPIPFPNAELYPGIPEMEPGIHGPPLPQVFGPSVTDVATPSVEAETPKAEQTNPRKPVELDSDTVRAVSDEVAARVMRMLDEKDKEDVARILPEVPDRFSGWAWYALGGAITLASITAAWRGSGKLLLAWRDYWDDVKAFNLGQELGVTPINRHVIIQEPDGKIRLEVQSSANPYLIEVLKRRSAVRLFKGAARLCTEEQPLPSLEVPNVKMGMERWLLIGRYPDPDRRLRELNKRVVDYYSARPVNAEGFGAKAVGLPTVNDVHYLIPICEVTGKERNLIFAAISKDQFNYFGDPNKVDRMRLDNPKQVVRINQLVAAWKANREYVCLGPGAVHGDDLFPDVRVSIKVGRKFFDGVSTTGANSNGVLDHALLLDPEQIGAEIKPVSHTS